MATIKSKSQLDIENIGPARFVSTSQNLVNIAGKTEFTYAVGQILPTGGNTLQLTASLQNFLASGIPQYQWQYINTTTNAWTNFANATTSVFDLAHDDAAWAGAESLRVRCFSRGYSAETIILKTYDLEDELVYSIELSSPILVKQALTSTANGIYSSISIQGKKRSLKKLAAENFGYVTVTRNSDAEAASANNTASVPYTLAPAADSQANTYTVKLYDSSTKTTLLDTQTVSVIYQGTGTITPVLSNDTHIFATNYNGIITNYVGSGTEIRVYEGTSILTYDGVGTQSGTWRISGAAGNGIVANETIEDNGIYATVLQASGMSNPTTTATIVYSIDGKLQNGNGFTTTVTQRFLKSKERSSIAVAIQGTSWDDNLVNSYFTNNYGSNKVFGDRATVYDEATAFVATREWNGTAWVLSTAKIDGNLLVTGSVTADRIDARGLSIKDANGKIILAAGKAVSGGVNLVGNSGFTKTNGVFPTNWTVYNTVSVTTSVQFGGMFGQNYYRITNNSSTTGALGIYISGNTNTDAVKSWEPGQTYCISFWAKSSVGALGKKMTAFYGSMGFTEQDTLENPALTSSWQRYVFRAIPQNNVYTVSGELYISWERVGTLSSGSVIDICCPKVELGFQPSSWTPSPQDTLNQNIIITPEGQLTGAGGGQVSISGLGYKIFRIIAYGTAATQVPAAGGLYRDAQLQYGVNRSYNLIRIRRTDGAITFNQFYDIFGNGALSEGRGASTLTADLNASTSSSIVVLYTHDEPQTNRLASSALATALYRCGASAAVFGSNRFKLGSAYALIGIPGCGPGNGAEFYQGAIDNDTKSWIDATFSVVNGNLTGVSGSYTPTSIQDYGYTGDLNATYGATFGTGTTPSNIAGKLNSTNAPTFIEDATITNAMITNLDAGKINAGTISVGLNITSVDGLFRIDFAQKFISISV
jgi:hypothetical protein